MRLLDHPLRCLLAMAFLSLGCSRSPVTKRNQFNLLPDSVMRPLGESAYKDMLAGADLLNGSTDHATLRKVGKRISRVADKPEYEWQYKLIDEKKTINAWCLPGGKIAFYTGILPVLKNEAGMAFVMGHEVGHATAHHGAVRMSQQLAVFGGLAGLYLYLDKKSEMNAEQKGLLLGALGVGATVGVVLPFSRGHEREADVIGMMYMARAGYPPGESIKVWDRMEKETGGSSVPAFLSTHPSNAKRQENLRDWMSRARKRYERNKLDRDTRVKRW